MVCLAFNYCWVKKYWDISDFNLEQYFIFLYGALLLKEVNIVYKLPKPSNPLNWEINPRVKKKPEQTTHINGKIVVTNLFFFIDQVQWTKERINICETMKTRNSATRKTFQLVNFSHWSASDMWLNRITFGRDCNAS